MPRWHLPWRPRTRMHRKSTRMSMPDVAMSAGAAVRDLTFGQAILEAITEEMDRDPRVCLMGEDVAEAGTTFKVLKGLVERFGRDRIIDTPISEAGFTGLGV